MLVTLRDLRIKQDCIMAYCARNVLARANEPSQLTTVDLD